MIIGTMSDDDYDALDGLRQSRLSKMKDSPGHYKYLKFKETKGMKTGTMLHHALSQPAYFSDCVAIEPDQLLIKGALVEINKRSKAHRDGLAQWRAKHSTKTIMTQKEHFNVSGMVAEISRSPLLMEIIHNGQPEVAVQWTYRDRLCKAKADIWYPNHPKYGNLVVDVKKTQSASESNFSRSVINYSYDLQSAFYLEGFKADTFLFIAIEEEGKPAEDGTFKHPWGLWNANIFQGAGRVIMDRLITRIEHCEKTQDWHWYTNGAETLRPPGWYSNLNYEQDLDQEFTNQ